MMDVRLVEKNDTGVVVARYIAAADGRRIDVLVSTLTLPYLTHHHDSWSSISLPFPRAYVAGLVWWEMRKKGKPPPPPSNAPSTSHEPYKQTD